MSEGLRLLMVVNAPWDRRLGAPRVQIELAEEFRALGHRVDKFSWEDAFPRPARMPRVAGLTRSFARRARAFIRERGRGYDVIDARAGAMPVLEAELDFDGLLVTRSTGLLAIYEREFVAADRARPGGGAGPLTAPARRLERAARERRHRLGIARCDLLNVLNSDELAYAGDELGIGERTVLFLHGLSAERAAAFAAARRPVSERLPTPVFAFIGSWHRRKGRGDTAAIVAATRAAAPGARFRFLGTGASAAEVIADCGGEAAGIEVVPRFESEELPGLLGDVAAGFLPSYVEGFPFGVLELLAAGAPVVAYDAPGARETLPRLDPSLLVRRGDGAALGARLGALLADPAELERLSTGAVGIAERLRWDEIAAATIPPTRSGSPRCARCTPPSDRGGARVIDRLRNRARRDTQRLILRRLHDRADGDLFVDYGWGGLIYSGDGDAQELMYHLHQREWHREIFAVLGPLVGPGDTVVDVGANLGFVCLMLAPALRPGGRILALEPSPRTYRKLLAAIEKNAIGDVVEPLNLGAGSAAGGATLHQVSSSSGNATILGGGRAPAKRSR